MKENESLNVLYFSPVIMSEPVSDASGAIVPETEGGTNCYLQQFFNSGNGILKIAFDSDKDRHIK